MPLIIAIPFSLVVFLSVVKLVTRSRISSVYAGPILICRIARTKGTNYLILSYHRSSIRFASVTVIPPLGSTVPVLVQSLYGQLLHHLHLIAYSDLRIGQRYQHCFVTPSTFDIAYDYCPEKALKEHSNVTNSIRTG